MTSSTSLIDCVCMLHATATLSPGMPRATAVLISGVSSWNNGVNAGWPGTLVCPSEVRIAHGVEHEVGAGRDAGRAADAGS